MQKEKEWMEVTVYTSSEAVETVSGFFYNTDIKGLSIEDSEDVEFKKKHPGDWDYFDETLLHIKKGAVIKAYYKENENFMEYFNYIKDSVDHLSYFGFDKGEGLVTYKKVNEEDWENNWKQYYKPTKIGDKVVIKPIWEKYSINSDEVVVELDPGMAFGTGTHETTRMCILALEKNVKPESTMFDIGTGSGILAITAAKLGAKHVTAVDLDPVAVDSAKKNISYNNLDNIEVIHGNLMDVVKGKANIVTANIIADVIILLADTVKNFITDDGIFICSGIIKDRQQDVIDKLISAGFEIVESNVDGEWVCITARIK